MLALQHWVSVSQGHQVMIATDNNTVVAYINKQAGTHSHTLLRPVVDLFLWLQTQDIAIRARHIPGCLNVIADRLSGLNQPITTEWRLHPDIVNQIFGTWGTPAVDMFATVHSTHLPQFLSPVPEPRALVIDALSQDWQGRSMYMFPPFPLLSKVIQKLRTIQEGEVIQHLSGRSYQSAHMEALMQHYQAAGFLKEVSRLAAAPTRPSTNKMYDYRGLRFTHWATGKDLICLVKWPLF